MRINNTSPRPTGSPWRVVLAVLALSVAGQAQKARIAEITDIEGVRQNIVRGIGLVVGLNKTGDRSQLSQRMVASIMQNNRINASISELGTGNAAVVMVTAVIDPFKRPGSRIDVTISSIQDAKSLFGGVLLETHLLSFDRKTVYGVAEGPISVGGHGASGQSGSSVTINHPTVGTIPGGALMEKAIDMTITDRRGMVNFNLKNQDWTTSKNIAAAINRVHAATARSVNAGSVEVQVPDAFKQRVTEFIASIQDLVIDVHTVSRVVINERTGIITAGQNVRISTTAVAHGKLTVTIREEPQVAAAAPFTNGPGLMPVPLTDVKIEEEDNGLQVVQGGESVARLAMSLNALGASPRQLIEIFKALKAQGALQADLVIM